MRAQVAAASASIVKLIITAAIELLIEYYSMTSISSQMVTVTAIIREGEITETFIIKACFPRLHLLSKPLTSKNSRDVVSRTPLARTTSPR
jgi:hypothetical protein